MSPSPTPRASAPAIRMPHASRVPRRACKSRAGRRMQAACQARPRAVTETRRPRGRKAK